MDDNEVQKRHDDYLKRRDELKTIRMDSFNSFDKAVLSLSTGSLALSITFLEKIGAPFNNFTYVCICLAWIAFFFVILSNLASYHFARANMDKKLEDLDRRYSAELSSGQQDTSPEVFFWQNRATNWCNSVALVSFTLGVMFFVIYIMIIQDKNFSDLQKKQKEEQKMAENASTINKGGTEIRQPIRRPPGTPPIIVPASFGRRGATESPTAIGRPMHLGRTESPQAVLRPVTTNTTSKK
jgi:hypothetical protein